MSEERKSLAAGFDSVGGFDDVKNAWDTTEAAGDYDPLPRASMRADWNTASYSIRAQRARRVTRCVSPSSRANTRTKIVVRRLLDAKGDALHQA